MIAGTVLVDTVKMISVYPPARTLAPIRSVHRALGGLVPNVAVDLAKLDPDLRIRAVSVVGDDDNARLVREVLGRYPSIDLKGIRTADVPTAFTDVMTVESTGERTFFTYVGASALLSADDFDFTENPPELLHIGYALLLPGLDADDDEFGTRMARVLAGAREAGVPTSLDVVSEAGDRFEKVVLPALKHTDYCTINEFEAEQITSIPLRGEDGALFEENMEEALRVLRRAGVSRWVTVHCPEGAFGLDEEDRYVRVPSEELPPETILSTVGAGDAFAAGILLGIAHDMSYEKTLRMANSTAAMSLTGVGASDGVQSMEEVLSRIAPGEF